MLHSQKQLVRKINPSTLWTSPLWATLMLVPIGIVIWTVLTYAINLPYWDDYLVQEHLLNIKTGSLSKRLAHLFDQHWEHRIVWTRLIFTAFAKVNGTLNYYGLTLIGLSGLLTLLGLLFVVFRTLKLPIIYFLPIPFWLFTLQLHENLIWGMASIQNFWILVFAVGSFYALAQSTRHGRVLAIVLAVVATFTSGNGALVLIAGLLVLAYQRQWQFAGIWLLITAGALYAYFADYKRVTFFPSPFNYPFLDWIKAFFIFLGAYADPFPYSGTAALGYQNPLWLSIFVGILIVGLVVYFAFSIGKSWLVPNQTPIVLFCLGCLLFLLGTAAITVYSRVGFAGPGYLLQGRYKIYSPLALSTVYFLWLYTTSNRSVLLVVLISSITIGQSLYSDYLCLEGVINQHRRTVTEYFNFLANTSHRRQKSISTVFKTTEKPFFIDHSQQLKANSWLSAPTTTAVLAVNEQRFLYNIPKNDAINPTLDKPTEGSYLLFKSLKHTYLFPARPLRPSPTAFLTWDHYFSSDQFYAQVLKEKLEPGQYRIGVLTNQNNRLHLAMTNRSVTFTSL